LVSVSAPVIKVFEEKKEMPRQTMFFTLLSLTLVFVTGPAFAQGKGGGSQPKMGAIDKDVKPTGDKEKGEADFVTKIEANPKLSAKLQPLLPSGESVSQAAAGFKNEGQFIAALHASHNLEIPFDQLKSKMTGSNPVSLGAAIKASRPNMSPAQSKDAAKRAEKEAKQSQKN
jgi:hypothetical protein